MIFIAIFFFIILIVVHEYGHFIAAKRNGVEVEEFGIGFPPKIVGKTFGRGIWRSYYTLNWLPLGGFVRLKGEADADKGEGEYGAASFWSKTKIILAGVFMNLVVAWMIFTALALTGIPSMVENQFSVDSSTSVKDYVAVGFVLDDTPASSLGLEIGDKIESIGGSKINSSEDLFAATEKMAGSEVEIVYDKGQGQVTSRVLLNEQVDGGGPILGVGPADIEVNRYGIIDAPIVGAGTTIQLASETYKGLGNLVGDVFGGEFSKAADNVSGPVGIFVILNNASVFGFEFMFFFIGIISLTLAVMNSLPIPALDGGKLFVSGIYKLLNKPLSKEAESAIHGTGFMILLGLILLISVIDFQRIF